MAPEMIQVNLSRALKLKNRVGHRLCQPDGLITTYNSTADDNTDSIQELAKFWDTHDLTDFEDELEEVAEPVFERDTPIKVHLASREAEAVEQMAQAKGVSREELICAWVLQKLARWKGGPTKR